MLLSLPASIPFDWQLAGIKKLDFASQCFSHCGLPRLRILWGLSEAPEGGGWQEGQEKLPRGRGQKTGMSPWPPPSSWTFLRFVSLCFCVISLGQKVPSIKDVCKPLIEMEGTVRSRGLPNT